MDYQSISHALYAGFISSIITTLILQPLDVTRLNQIAKKTKLMETITTIYDEGFFTFYRALPISIMAYCASFSIFFPMSTYLKNTNFLNIENNFLKYLYANIPTSIISMTICNPLWTIKSNQVTAPLTLMQATRKVYENFGYRGYYRGLLFGYLNNVNGILTFTFYDLFRDCFVVHSTGDITTWEILICSMSSKFLATIICYPLLVVRIRQQVGQDNVISMFNVKNGQQFKEIFYGLLVSLLQQVIKQIVLMILYEHVLVLLK